MTSPTSPPDQPTAHDYEGAFDLLARMAEDFAANLDLQETVRRALTSIVALVHAQAGSFWLLTEDQRELLCLASVGPNPITGLRLPAGEGIVGKTVARCACQRVLDTTEDPDFSSIADETSGMLTRSLICSPLRFGERALGAVELINKQGESACFDEADATLLKVLASSAGLAIANSRLAAAQRAHERTTREIELVGEIQRNLLPARQPAPFPAVGLNLPARVVSGDFFDILPLSQGRIGFCLGDVSGKGINAALLMAKTASLYRCVARDHEAPGAVLERLNEELCETATRGMFVTMVAGVYDPRDGTVELASAGHEPAIVRYEDGRVDRIEAGAPPLGILPGQAFPAEEVALEGGSIYLCSDGLTEACSGGREIGSEGFEELVVRYADKPLHERVDAIAAEAGSFELRDDLTLLALSDAERPRAVFEQRITARPEQLKPLRDALCQALQEHGLAMGLAKDVVLAVDEACQNVIRHAYGEDREGDILLRVERRGDRLVLDVIDYAPPTDPAQVVPRDLADLRPGGLGTHFIAEVMDSAEFLEAPAGCGNLLRLEKRLP